MISYRLVVFGYSKNCEKCPIGYQMFDNIDEAHLQGQAICDILSSLTGIYACYGYDVYRLDLSLRPQEV